MDFLWVLLVELFSSVGFVLPEGTFRGRLRRLSIFVFCLMYSVLQLSMRPAHH